jgi:hypothetical protein
MTFDFLSLLKFSPNKYKVPDCDVAKFYIGGFPGFFAATERLASELTFLSVAAGLTLTAST